MFALYLLYLLQEYINRPKMVLYYTCLYAFIIKVDLIRLLRNDEANLTPTSNHSCIFGFHLTPTIITKVPCSVAYDGSDIGDAVQLLYITYLY